MYMIHRRTFTHFSAFELCFPWNFVSGLFVTSLIKCILTSKTAKTKACYDYVTCSWRTRVRRNKSSDLNFDLVAIILMCCLALFSDGQLAQIASSPRNKQRLVSLIDRNLYIIYSDIGNLKALSHSMHTLLSRDALPCEDLSQHRLAKKAYRTGVRPRLCLPCSKIAWLVTTDQFVTWFATEKSE